MQQPPLPGLKACTLSTKSWLLLGAHRPPVSFPWCHGFPVAATLTQSPPGKATCYPHLRSSFLLFFNHPVGKVTSKLSSLLPTWLLQGMGAQWGNIRIYVPLCATQKQKKKGAVSGLPGEHVMPTLLLYCTCPWQRRGERKVQSSLKVINGHRTQLTSASSYFLNYLFQLSFQPTLLHQLRASPHSTSIHNSSLLIEEGFPLPLPVWQDHPSYDKHCLFYTLP